MWKRFKCFKRCLWRVLFICSAEYFCIFDGVVSFSSVWTENLSRLKTKSPVQKSKLCRFLIRDVQSCAQRITKRFQFARRSTVNVKFYWKRFWTPRMRSKISGNIIFLPTHVPRRDYRWIFFPKEKKNDFNTLVRRIRRQIEVIRTISCSRGRKYGARQWGPCEESQHRI